MAEREQNVPEIGERMWKIFRAVIFMFRKGASSKQKLLLDLNLVMKRGKLAGKAIGNLLTFHHPHHHQNGGGAAATELGRRVPLSPTDYEFSCSNTPAGPTKITYVNRQRRRHHHHSHFFSACVHAPPSPDDCDGRFMTVNAVKKMLEMLSDAEEASPEPGSGFGRSPCIGHGRPLRITDSPFPLGDGGGDCHVDEAAEEFIRRFYKELEQQGGKD